MSLMHNKIVHLAGSPERLELTTLLLQEVNLENFWSNFFRSMPKLVVLDLSLNDKLSRLPEEISNLVSMQYLNLSDPGICHLPKGLQELKKLIHLDLEGTSELESIAGISSLQNLKVLKLDSSSFRWDLDIVRELKVLEHIEVLTITIGYRSTELFLSSKRLMSCTQSVLIKSLKSSGISLY